MSSIVHCGGICSLSFVLGRTPEEITEIFCGGHQIWTRACFFGLFLTGGVCVLLPFLSEALQLFPCG